MQQIPDNSIVFVNSFGCCAEKCVVVDIIPSGNNLKNGYTVRSLITGREFVSSSENIYLEREKAKEACAARMSKLRDFLALPAV